MQKEFTVHWKVDLNSLFNEVSEGMEGYKQNGIAHGFKVADGLLRRIADRALKLEDTELCALIERLGYLVIDNQPEPERE